ncbi:MAG: PAS domain-containing protein [Bacteroidales bacterium]|nr:PAS domain-containing protein [Bacteroidales bacterium]
MPKKTVTSKEKSPDKVNTLFPIVGIGASAGGLEALDEFLSHVPDESGMAYVVIQHLDPTQKGMLPELLQRTTSMKVYQVKDRMHVKPNCVYVIPPNTSMSILKGVLYLFEPLEIRGLRLPVDFFMRSLADDQHERAIGVILSGMGSDGSIGLRAIKENHGIVVVQEPETAKYDNMPCSAIESAVVDLVAPANALPKMILDFMNRIPDLKSNLEIDSKDKSSLEKIIILLRSNTGNDFSMYKKSTVYRRIERRMAVHKINRISSYVHFLQENPGETNILFKELMIGVTNFFRDAPVWDKLKASVLPEIIKSLKEVSILRAWVPACSTGEEAYSLAMIFREAVEKVKPQGRISLQIFASDLDSEAIETARRAFFPANIAADVSAARLSRFFNKTEEGYQVKKEIRELVVFANHNILMHPPFTKIDILSCRNLLIYLDSELQEKILRLFYYSLNPNGYMVLGSSETLGNQSNLFRVVDSKLKIFRQKDASGAPELYDFPSSFSKSQSASGTEKQIPYKSMQNVQTMADQLLLQHFSPAGVLVNEEGDIIYISGRTGKYLEPSVGKANMNIFVMLREGLRNEFPTAFRKAIKKGETVVLHNLKVESNGSTLKLNVTIQWIDKPKQLNGYLMIVFSEINDPPEPDRHTGKTKKTLTSQRQIELEKELQQTREEMQSTHEEMQTSQEELKSTNEELQSTNEELQSTNEELTTSKEEMQSLNEELQTVNAELQSKVEEYSRVDSDMKNLLNSTNIATLFLDKDLNIRRYTNQATKIFKLIKSDIGRSFTDLVSILEYPELADDAMEVLRTLVFIQKQVPTKDGRWFSIRIMPYRTVDDRIDGLVITFFDLSDLKKIESKLHETEQMNRSLLNSSRSPILKLSLDGKIEEFNLSAEKFFGKKRSEMIDQDFITIFIPEKSRKKSEKELQDLPVNMSESNIKMQVIANSGKIEAAEWSVSVLLNYLKLPVGLLLTKHH